jgi:hypothetical protein
MALLLLEQRQHSAKLDSEETRDRDQNTRLKDKDRPKLIRAKHTAVIIDMIGLLGAYAAAVLLYIAIHLSMSFFHQKLKARQANPVTAIALAWIFVNGRPRRSRGPN